MSTRPEAIKSAIHDLADLYTYGHLMLAQSPTMLIRECIAEITRLRRRLYEYEVGGTATSKQLVQRYGGKEP